MTPEEKLAAILKMISAWEQNEFYTVEAQADHSAETLRAIQRVINEPKPNQ